MIIKKNNIQNKDKTNSKNENPSNNIKSKNILKKEDLILDSNNIKNTNTKEEIPQITPKKPEVNEEVKQETFEKIDISSIEFKERVERRKGDRRRGYRRIDERSLVSRAQVKARNIKELAAREGYQNGLKKAKQEISDLKNNLEEFLLMKDEMYEKFYPHILEMSLEISKKIIKKEVDLSQDVLKNIIVGVMEELNPDTQKITIKVNDEDVEFARASIPEILSLSKMNSNVKISVTNDKTIEVGSCMLVANNGVIDANFKTQLSILQSAFGIYQGGL